MSTLYENIEKLCHERGISVTQLCNETGISRATLTDLKKGRNKNLSGSSIAKIAKYFNVLSDYIMGVSSCPHTVATTEDIKFALFNGADDITDEMFEEVKQFAEMVKLREEAKRNK